MSCVLIVKKKLVIWFDRETTLVVFAGIIFHFVDKI